MTSFKTAPLVTLAFGALLLGGCGMLKKKQADPAASATPAVAVAPPAASTPAPAAAPAEAAVVVADDAVPAPEDFEDEAFEKISDKTYKTDLADLKKEIEAN